MKSRTRIAIVVLVSCGPGPRVDTETDAGDPDGNSSYTCAQAELDHGYVGCEYWPVDLDNAIEVMGAPVNGGCGRFGSYAHLQPYDVCWDGASHGLCDPLGSCPMPFACENHPVCVLDAQHSPFAIVVSNPDPMFAVTATLTNAAGTSASVVVEPSAVHTIFPQQLGFADASLDGTGIEAKAYRLVSERPIVAYQFNPLDHVGVFSNDASLLIPAQTYATDYLVMTYKTALRRPATNDYQGYATVVGAGPGPTTVTVTPTANVVAGGSVGAIAAGTTQTFVLAQFETLNLEAAASFDVDGGDLTGSVIACSQPCGVFVGHEATNVSPAAQPQCCADHLEEQLFPATTWGKTYALTVSMPRATMEPDLFRVMAQHADTLLTFDPPQAGCPASLGRGEHCDIAFAGDLVVTASRPILVGHFLQSNGGLGADSGDPSLAFPAPTEQFRSDYILLVPAQYNANYINVVTSATGTLFLDGIEMTGLTPFGDSQWKAARLAVTPGQHHVTCPERCGVEVYGWANAVSYLFAGGLDLAPIIE